MHCFLPAKQSVSILLYKHISMDYSDDDVSVSDGSEGGDQRLNGVSDDEEDVDFSDVSEEPSEDATEPGSAAAAAGAPAAVAAAAAVAPSGARDVTQALISGEMSSQTALLQMELSELLSEVASARNHAKQSVVQAAVSALTAALTSLPRTSASAAAAANGTGTAAALGAAISSLGLDAQGVSLDVCPPSCVQLVGSWADGSAVNLPGSSVDVAVQIPSSSIHHKDHLNFRYHAKRALYLAQLSQHLAAHPTFSTAQQQATALQGDPYRPALLLHLDTAALSTVLQQQQSAQKAARGSNTAAAANVFGSAGLTLRLLPTIGLDCFDLAKLAPSRNNIRWAVSAPAGATGSSSGKVVPQQQDGNGQQELPPTPHYNAGVLQDMLLLVSSHKQQQAVHAGGVRFADALVLLKVWAQQHGLSTHGVLPLAAPECYGQHSQHGQHKQQQQAGGLLAAASTAVQADGFTGHLLCTLLIAAVQRTGAAALSMSSLQLFKAALQLLADKQQWVKGAGVSLTRDSSVPADLRKQHQQKQQTGAVEGQVSKDHARLLQKLQQQLQSFPAPTDTPAAFRKAYGAVLLDGSGHLNLAAGVSSTQLQLAQAAAQQSLSVLNRQSLDPDAVYAAVFKPGQGLAKVFHYTWTVELPDSSGSSSTSRTQQQQPGDQHTMRLAEAEVEGLVRAALGSRARLVKAVRRAPLILTPSAAASGQQQPQPEGSQQQQQQRKKAKHSHKQLGASPSPLAAAAAAAGGGVCVPRRIVVGAVVDPVAVLRLVDVGPAADDAAAAGKFRKLWGDKSELRRFQDGKICEAVVWEGVPTGLRHQIADLAAVHILQRHLPAGTVITSCATALDPLLYAASNGSDADAEDNMQWAEAAAAAAAAAAAPAAAGGSSSSGSSSISIGGSSGSAAAEETAASRAADAALDSLTKQLRALSDLALKVIGVQPLSSVTRHTCCFYPEAHPLAEGSGARAYTLGAKVPRVLEAIDVMVQLESTGKMPLHPEAFAKTKAALGVQLASTLSAASGAHVTATEEALEVLWQGFAFKLILYLDRESTVINVPASNGSSGSGSSGQQPLPVLLSQHHGLVSALVGAHAAYAPTVRLAKRWLGAQLLLGGQVCEEAVELLVGAVFQGPSTAPPPASRITGLLGFLHLLASHPWQAAPLLVDPSGEVTQEQKQALQAEYESRRQANAAPAMFIATPYDLQTSRWTSQHPSSLVASHLVSLAHAAWHTLSQLLLLGADAPIAQQQLALLQQDQQQQQAEPTAAQKKRGKQLQDTGLHEAPQGLHHMEGCALGRAWRVLCVPVLTGFDALILLRKEALPFADRSDPFAVQQLQLLVAQQHRQQRRLAAGQKHQQHGVLQQLLGDHGGGSVKCAAPKNARAILRSIPEQVLLSKPANKLRSELLVGFDPVNLYLSLLSQRYGHLAQFCADSSSGFPAIGIKWQPAAFLPGPLRPNLAHAHMEECVTAAAAVAPAGGKSAGKGGKGSNSKGLVVPNLPQLLSEAAEMGLGLVEEVLLL